MATPKKYFHDHVVLLLLSINAFLALAGSIIVLIRLSTGNGSGYIVQYRSNLGVNNFQPGSVVELLSMVGFALLVFAIHTLLSLKVYKLQRQLSITILALGILLLTLMIIVSNALLVLR